MDTAALLAEIGAEMGDPENPPTTVVPREKVLTWMQSGDIEVLGRTFYFMTDKRHSPRIRPALAFEDYHPFAIRYYKRCFRENPEESKWALGRYPAGWSFVNWFAGLWNVSTVPRKALNDLKQLLATLYKEGDSALRTCIVTAILEHLFERRTIAKFFSNWEQDPILRTAYQEGMQWPKGGGRTPLGKPPPKRFRSKS